MARVPKVILVGLLLIAGLALSLPVAVAEIAPALDADTPDPSIAYDRQTGEYYLVTTQAVTPQGFRRVPMWASDDLRTWRFVGSALRQLGAWATGSNYSVAPSIAQVGGVWNLYYTALDSSGRTCIGVATAQRPLDRFADSRGTPLVCASGDGNGVIDPSVFVDIDGATYLHWKNEGSEQIFAQRLRADGGDVTGSPVNVFNPNRPWHGTGVENPSMLWLGNRYFMLFSYNFWETANYATGLVECAGPLGPCAESAGLLSSGDVVGPGGASVFMSPSGEPLVAYHGWRGAIGYADGGRRALYVGSLVPDANGVPAVRAEMAVAFGAHTPFGSLDTAYTDADGRAVIEGWVIDRDHDGPVEVRAYVNGVYNATTLADISRRDVAAAYQSGEFRGFRITTSPGNVCLYPINRPAGGNPLLGCRTIGVQSPSGSLDSVTEDVGGVRVQGWALDLDAKRRPAEVHLYVDGRLARGLIADRERADVAAAFNDAGLRAGFDEVLGLSAGLHALCAYAINSGPGDHSLLGCRLVSVGTLVGSVDAVSQHGATVRVEGWTLDQSSAEPIEAHVYVDGVGVAAAIAKQPRPDLVTAYPHQGTDHGFAVDVPAATGSRNVCVYAVSGVRNRLIGCRNIVIA